MLIDTIRMFSFNGQRPIAVAFALSLLLHLLLLLGVAVRPGAPPGAALQSATVNVNILPAQRPAVVAPVPVQPEHAAPAEMLPLPKPQPQSEQAEAPVAQQPPPKPEASTQDEPSGRPAINVPLIHDPVFYPAKQVDVHPSALAPINPAYPDDAAQRNVTGKVMLLLLIDETGKVVDVSVVDATPPGYFEDSAVAAFRSARFSPAEKGGRKVKSRVLIQVSFELTNPPAGLLP